jgi:hypothetical protein
MGKDIGFDPVDLNDALASVFGGLFVFIPPSGNQTELQPLYSVSPAVFDRVVTADELHPNGGNVTDDVKISAQGASSAAANFPIFGKIGIDTTSNSVYEVSWTLSQFGMVDKPPKNFTLAGGLQKLAQGDKDAICSRLKNNVGAEAIYVNQMYLIKSAVFQTTQGKQLTVGAKLDAGSIISGSTAWTFDNEGKHTSSFPDVVLNIVGDPISMIDLGCTPPPAVDVHAPAPPPPEHPTEPVQVSAKGMRKLIIFSGHSVTDVHARAAESK